MIGRLPYYYFLLLQESQPRTSTGLEYCRITTSFYFLGTAVAFIVDWKTAVFILLFTVEVDRRFSEGLEDCRITTSFYFFGQRHANPSQLEYCRITTSFYLFGVYVHHHLIGRLPYLYFLLLHGSSSHLCADWKTAVLLLPSTRGRRLPVESVIGRLPYYYFLLLPTFRSDCVDDWKTAVLLLPSTRWLLALSLERIGRLPYYYFLLLPNGRFFQHQKLEDCRIYTSFYSAPAQLGFWIGRLPYLYFLLLRRTRKAWVPDWKTAVFILPFTCRTQ